MWRAELVVRRSGCGRAGGVAGLTAESAVLQEGTLVDDTGGGSGFGLSRRGGGARRDVSCGLRGERWFDRRSKVQLRLGGRVA